MIQNKYLYFLEDAGWFNSNCLECSFMVKHSAICQKGKHYRQLLKYVCIYEYIIGKGPSKTEKYDSL